MIGSGRNRVNVLLYIEYRRAKITGSGLIGKIDL